MYRYMCVSVSNAGVTYVGSEKWKREGFKWCLGVDLIWFISLSEKGFCVCEKERERERW